MRHNHTMMRLMIAALVAGVFATPPPAVANPPDCANPDGSPCAVVDSDGATGSIPGGPAGTVGPDLIEGSIPGGPSGEITPNVIEGSIPGGPSGEITPTDVSGCVPGIGCLNIPG